MGRMVPCVKLHFIGWPSKSKHHLDAVTGNQYFIDLLRLPLPNITSFSVKLKKITKLHDLQSTH